MGSFQLTAKNKTMPKTKKPKPKRITEYFKPLMGIPMNAGGGSKHKSPPRQVLKNIINTQSKKPFVQSESIPVYPSVNVSNVILEHSYVNVIPYLIFRLRFSNRMN